MENHSCLLVDMVRLSICLKMGKLKLSKRAGRPTVLTVGLNPISLDFLLFLLYNINIIRKEVKLICF
jgi:hypothetical protein